VRADEFVEIDGEARRYDAEVGAEVERRGDGKRGLRASRILLQRVSKAIYLTSIRRALTQSLSLPSIPTSTSAC
jgi:hypothetical protein